MRQRINKIIILICLVVISQFVQSAQYDAGDLAPRSTPDGELNTIDVLLLQRFLSGLETPTATEHLIADVAPLGNPDGSLNAADLLILQRAIFGDITLAPIITLPTAPILTQTVTQTSLNPFPISGSSQPLTNIDIYVNGVLQQQTMSNISGNIGVNLYLYDGDNEIVAVASDNDGVSPSSNSLQVHYNNTIPRIQNNTVISEGTVWTPGIIPEPYIITTNLTVGPGVSFVIQPGTELKFDSGASLIVNGEIIITGQPLNKVKLTSSNISPVRGSWSGIKINNTSNNSVINNAFIEWANTGVDVNAATNVSINNCVIQNYSHYGVYFHSGATGNITNNTIDNVANNISNTYAIYLNQSSPSILSNIIINTYYGLYIELSSPVVQENLIKNNSYGVYIKSASIASLSKNEIIYNKNTGIHLFGSIGNPEPVINRNSIFNNGTTSVSYPVGSSNFIAALIDPLNTHVQAYQNWWGTTDVNDISKSVSKGGVTLTAVVDFSQYLNGPDGIPVPSKFLLNYIDTDETIVSGESVYVIGKPTVTAAAILTINEGSTIKFVDGSQLVVDGTLNILGSVLNPVTLTAANKNPVNTSWNGILTNPTSTNLIVQYTNIDWVSYGVQINGSSNFTLKNNKISSYSSRAISIRNNASGLIEDNTIGQDYTRGSGQGIYLEGSSATIRHNHIYAAGLGVYLDKSLLVTIDGNKIKYNTTGISLSDSSPDIIANDISNNTSVGIYMKNLSNPVINNGNVISFNFIGIQTDAPDSGNIPYKYPQPVVTGNSIFSNLSQNYRALSNFRIDVTNLVLDATANWWGTTNVSLIKASIYDQLQDLSVPTYSPKVNFIQFLDAPDGSLVAVPNVLGGTLLADMTLVPGTSYTVTDDLIVPMGITLTVTEGVKLFFARDTQLLVNGVFNVMGSQLNPVLFIPDNAQIRGGNEWKGIELSGSSLANINYALIEFAETGIFVNGANNSVISNSVIRNYYSNGVKYVLVNNGTLTGNIIGDIGAYSHAAVHNGVYMQESSVLIQGNIIRFTDYGIYLDASSPTITANYIHNNTEAGVAMVGVYNGVGCNPVMQLNIISNNRNGVIITGVDNDTYNHQPVITNNDIYANTTAQVFLSRYNGSTLSLTMTSNWWGTLNPTINSGTSSNGATFWRYNGTASNSVFNYTSYLNAAALIPLSLSNIESNSFIIRNVSHSQMTINAAKGETTQINFTLPVAALVNLKITSAIKKSVVKNMTQNFTGPGNYSLSWDGKDDTGNILEDEAYIYTLTGNSGQLRAYVEGGSRTTKRVSIGQQYLDGDIYKNIFWKQQVSVDKPSRITLCIGILTSADYALCHDVNNIYAIANDSAEEPGLHWMYWDGRGALGGIGHVDDTFVSSYTYGPVTYLASNTIIIKGSKPSITGGNTVAPNIEVRSNPYLVHHSYDQFSRFNFQIDQDSLVTVKILPPGITDFNSASAILIPEYSNQLLSAELSPGVPSVYTVQWLGYDAIDTNAIKMSEEGLYTYVIEATSSLTGFKNLYRGSLTLFQ